MAYPFGHWTWRGLIDEFASKGIKFRDGRPLTSPDGITRNVQYFETGEGPARRRYVVTFADQNETVHPDVLRSICAGLGVSAKEFGLELG